MTVNKTPNSNNQTWLKDNHVWRESPQARHPTDMVNGNSHKMNTSDFCMYGGCWSTYIHKRPNMGNALRGLFTRVQSEKDGSNKTRCHTWVLELFLLNTPVTIFLHQQIPAATSCAPAATSPASVTFLQQWLPVLHQQLPVLHQRPPSFTSYHLPAPADTSDYQSRTSDWLPAPAIISLHQQISAATSSAPATTSLEPATTFLHQQIPATTSPGLATTFLHQQIPVLNQRPSSCTSRNQSCSSDHLSNEY